MDKTIYDKLQQFASAVRKTVIDGVSTGELQPDVTPARRWKVDKFSYTDEGITAFGATGEDYIKKTWFMASSAIANSLTKLNEYTAALDHLASIFTKRNNLSTELEYFGRKAMHLCFNSPSVEESAIDSLVEIFQKNLRGEPVKYGATVELAGVVLQPERINMMNS